jgi:hypothetical protein
LTTAIETRERPILFTGEMVKAILQNQKTVTRRIVSKRNSTVLGYTGSQLWSHLHFNYDKDGFRTYVDGPNDTMFGCGPSVQYLHVPAWHPNDGEKALASYRVRPIWEVGERLWVRETFACHDTDGRFFPESFAISYAADDDGESVKWIRDIDQQKFTREYATGKNRPSIFMPRWASRLTVEITGVSGSRIQEITEEGAKKEGFGPGFVPDGQRGYGTVCVGHRPLFASKWDVINGNGAWVRNDWVWAIEFKRIKP